MPGEAIGAMLRSLRESRGWDKRRTATELRAAADEPLPPTLHKMIGRWEAGLHVPQERYLLLYRKVFPGWRVNGTVPHGPDPQAVLDRARRLPGSTAALEAAAEAAGKPELAAMAAAMKDLEQQIAVLRDRLEQQIAGLREARDRDG